MRLTMPDTDLDEAGVLAAAKAGYAEGLEAAALQLDERAAAIDAQGHTSRVGIISADILRGEARKLRALSPPPFPSAQPAGAVRVKPLEWFPVEGLPCTRERALALGGEYEIVRLDGDHHPPSVCFRVGVLSFVFILEDDPLGGKRPRQFESVAEAKAAAQADYETRVLSALAPTAGAVTGQSDLQDFAIWVARMAHWEPIQSIPRDGRQVAVWIIDPGAKPYCISPISVTDDGAWWDDSTGDQIEQIPGAVYWQEIAPPHPDAPVEPASPAMAAWPEHASKLPWTYNNLDGQFPRDWIEDAHGNIVVEHIGHIDGPAICAAVNALSTPPESSR